MSASRIREESVPFLEIYDSLSVREARVAELVADGLTVAAIAAKLNVSRSTVEKCRARIIGKTASKSVPGVCEVVFWKRLVDMNPIDFGGRLP